MVKIKIPATSCNLGPGLDTIGVALQMYNEIHFHRIQGKKGQVNRYSPKNLIYQAYKKTFELAGKKEVLVDIRAKSSIPSARGLGSSAACIVGGIYGAIEIGKLKVSLQDILDLAVAIEGYPDNVSPCILGGMVTTVVQDKKIITSRIDVGQDLYFNVLIPSFRLRTEDSRKFLPKKVDLEDAIFNISRAAMFVSSMINKDYDKLKISMGDALHEKYRGKHIADYDKIRKFIETTDSIGAYLSGSGPCIVVITKQGQIKAVRDLKSYLQKLDSDWIIRSLKVEKRGAHVVKTRK